MAGRSNMRPSTPSGEGELVRAADLIDRVGIRIRLNPGGGEYEAVLYKATHQVSPHGWIRLRHKRDGVPPTTNVVPPGTEVRIVN